MSEMGEMPHVPQPEPEVPPMRLEDNPNFQKLAPEQQEKILALRERLMSEAANPEQVVSRSINEMGFFEGLKETVKPHLKAQKEIAFKELKAGASLALSLIPVLGEGKGLGTGLFGLTKNADLAWKDVNAASFASKAIQFEPAVRLGKAAERVKTAYNSGRVVNGIVRYSPLAAEATLSNLNAHPEKGLKVIRRAKELVIATKSKARDIFSMATSPLAAKNAGLSSLTKDFSEASQEGTKLLTKNMLKGAGVRGVAELQKRAEFGAKAAYVGKLKEAGLTRDVAWYNLVDKWRYRGALKTAKAAAKEVTDKTNLLLDAHLADRMLGKNVVQKGMESFVLKKAPGAIEKTAAAAKNIQFKAFFERWLNFTPDVPHWISYTTGVAEFLGAHGIDAIPAVMQMGINRYKQVMVSKDMAMDVLGYTAGRVLKKVVERKGAAEVFAT